MASRKQSSKWEQLEDEESGSEGMEDAMQGEVDAEEVEAPKFAQYIDSDEEDQDEEQESEEEQHSSEEDDVDQVDNIQEEALRTKMEKVPFSALIRAQRSIKGGRSGEEGEDSEEDEFEVERIQGRKRLEKKSKGFQDLQKRENKHAPTEMSSRKPVSRRRAVVETQGNVTRRDPRFSSLSASIPNIGLFNSSYGFLREKQSSEVSELQSVFNKLKRQEANHAGPKAKSELAQSIQKERQEIEMTLKRAEGRENERRTRERQRNVIQREKKVIQDRVKEGGKVFYLKESAKKQLILKDKFNRLSGSRQGDDNDGNSRKDLKRAIERRRKKNAAKERREMPLGGGSSSRPDSNSIPKRKRMAYSSNESNEGTSKRGRRD